MGKKNKGKKEATPEPTPEPSEEEEVSNLSGDMVDDFDMEEEGELEAEEGSFDSKDVADARKKMGLTQDGQKVDDEDSEQDLDEQEFGDMDEEGEEMGEDEMDEDIPRQPKIHPAGY